MIVGVLVYTVLITLDKFKCIFVLSFYDFWFIVCVTLPSQSYVLLSVTSLKLSVLKNTLKGICQNHLTSSHTVVYIIKFTNSNTILLCISLGLMTLILRRFLASFSWSPSKPYAVCAIGWDGLVMNICKNINNDYKYKGFFWSLSKPYVGWKGQQEEQSHNDIRCYSIYRYDFNACQRRKISDHVLRWRPFRNANSWFEYLNILVYN